MVNNKDIELQDIIVVTYDSLEQLIERQGLIENRVMELLDRFPAMQADYYETEIIIDQIKGRYELAVKLYKFIEENGIDQ